MSGGAAVAEAPAGLVQKPPSQDLLDRVGGVLVETWFGFVNSGRHRKEMLDRDALHPIVADRILVFREIVGNAVIQRLDQTLLESEANEGGRNALGQRLHIVETVARSVRVVVLENQVPVPGNQQTPKVGKLCANVLV
jgi:hypothetical protein